MSLRNRAGMRRIFFEPREQEGRGEGNPRGGSAKRGLKEEGVPSYLRNIKISNFS